MQTKSEMINRIAELAKENAELKENIEDLSKDLKVQNKIIGKLEAENDRYYKTLQKIEEIAEDTRDCKQYEIDHDCFNNTRCKALREFIETLQEILDLITKSESEG